MHPTLRSPSIVAVLVLATACSVEGTGTASPSPAATVTVKRDTPPPPLDPDNIVSIAVGSKDHTTLVAALQAADYVKSVANPGPLTVFAPTNAAFDLLPPGTVATLVKPEKQADLREILKYHVAAAVYEQAALKDGMVLGMANGKKVTFRKADGKLKINDATVLASIRASNGIVHVIDRVLLPPTQ
ncbi:MAG: fasciclin domain-containing protein [Planctomycetota bacterium]